MKNLLITALLLITPLLLSAQEEYSVYFDTNKSEPNKKELAGLETWIAAHKDSKILAINGYTDEDGAVGLNDTLAQHRVSRVFALIAGRVPMREDFRTRSFGELHKQSPIKAMNRKATIYFLQKKDLARENEVLGIKPVSKAPVSKPMAKSDITYPATVMAMGPGGKQEALKLDVAFMKQLAATPAGGTIRIPNLNFQENTFAIMPDSRARMYELLEVMNANPGMKIKLQGHVCCMKADRQNLSTQRAKAIMLFLNNNGIEKNRLSFEGFGVSKPVYAIPEKNAEEREANRRVEVLVVENP